MLGATTTEPLFYVVCCSTLAGASNNYYQCDDNYYKLHRIYVSLMSHFDFVFVVLKTHIFQMIFDCISTHNI